MRDFEETVKAALRALNSAEAEYAIIGGLVAIFYGRPRTTSDIDIIVDFSKADSKRIERSLRKEGFEVSQSDIQRALAEKSHFTVFDAKSPYRLDIQGVYNALDESSFRGRRRSILFGEQAWVESPEDLIVAKLVYGSSQDLEDGLAIMIRQGPNLNGKYLGRQAAKNKVSSKLRKLIELTEGAVPNEEQNARTREG
jgi:hypothetical protein